MGNFKRAFDLCSLSQKVFTSDGSYRLFGRYSSAIIFTGLGLALMFGGIWIGDAQVLTALNASWGTLVMRVFSCLIYLCLFLMLLRMHRQGKDPRPFLLRSVRITCLALVLGMVIICIMLPFYADGSSLFLLWGIVALFLTKCIGAPVSVLLVCAFARLDRARTIRLVTFGMIGAFTFYSLISQLYTAELISDLCVIVFSCVMLCASGLLGCIGSGLWTSVPYDNKNDSLTDDAHAIGRLGVIKRPVRQVMSPGFLMEACFSAIMLGFLRSGMQISDPHMQPIVIVTLLILILVALMWRGLCVEYIFNGALICTSVGLLLCPIFDVGGDAAVAVDGIGTALFEVVMWSLAVWAARNSRETLLAAAGTRFASVCGHLLGTIIMLLGFYAAGSSEEALRICAPFIMFAYMLMLLILLKWPGLQTPFMSFDMTSCPLALPDFTHAVQKSSASRQLSAHELDERYWGRPCKIIADTYDLTTREGEVFEQLARGYDIASMATRFVLSRSTLKMHIRHIYLKLDVHSKQDVINMVEQVRVRLCESDGKDTNTVL